jgi:prepilin-type processing-associated H-X9-DG protein
MMAPSFLKSREQALRVRSASNLRQMLQMCMMYSNEHKGAWPADYKALQEASKKLGSPNAAQIFTNPARPETAPAYVYVKPDDVQGMANAGEHLVMYEAHKEFGDGVNVGFADGHVEYISNQNRFNELLAKSQGQ